MAIISNNIKDYAAAYDGYDRQAVGIGLQTGTYATPAYQDRKIQNLAIGLISSVVYSGMEHDPNPLIMPMFYESAYNTIMAYNLHYVPEPHRRAIVKYVLDSNAARIQNNQPMLVDYNSLKRAIPISQYIVRRYKTIGLRVIDTYQLVEFPDAIDGVNPWQEHYRTLMG